jgi:hypothetical protein
VEQIGAHDRLATRERKKAWGGPFARHVRDCQPGIDHEKVEQVVG